MPPVYTGTKAGKYRQGLPFGAVAQPGERCNGIAKVGGSIPPGSTILAGCLAGSKYTITDKYIRTLCAFDISIMSGKKSD